MKLTAEQRSDLQKCKEVLSQFVEKHGGRYWVDESDSNIKVRLSYHENGSDKGKLDKYA